MADPTPTPEFWVWTEIKRFLYDENYAVQVIRSVMGVIGLGVVSGVLSVPDLPDSWAWLEKLIGLCLTAIAWWIRAGDKTLDTLAKTSDKDLHDVGVATTKTTPVK